MEGQRPGLGFATTLAQLLFPIECVGCGREQVHICVQCLGRIRRMVLEEQNPALAGLFWLGPYTSQLLQQAIYALKYDGRWGIGNPLGQLLGERLLRSTVKECTIIPIPLFWRRKSQRGFNQAQEISNGIARVTGWGMRTDIIERIRATAPQARQEQVADRSANVAGAFAGARGIRAESIPERIVLVDDVWTTGSTMREACRVLRQAGVKEIIGAVVAKG